MDGGTFYFALCKFESFTECLRDKNKISLLHDASVNVFGDFKGRFQFVGSVSGREKQIQNREREREVWHFPRHEAQGILGV